MSHIYLVSSAGFSILWGLRGCRFSLYIYIYVGSYGLRSEKSRSEHLPKSGGARRRLVDGRKAPPSLVPGWAKGRGAFRAWC